MNFIKNKNLLIHVNQINLFLFLFFIFMSYEEEKINIISKGKGDFFFLNSEFYIEPDEVIIDGLPNISCKKNCYLNEDINNITIIFNHKIESCENMFSGLSNIIEIDLSEFDTSNVIHMGYMFNDCINLEKIIFGNINTSFVKNMNHLFANCQLLSIDLSNFDTSFVTTMQSMFSNCEIITSLDVSKFNTRNVEDMRDMFSRCYKLTSINISNFDTSKVTSAWALFHSCYELIYLDLSNFQTPVLTNVRSMFRFDAKLVYINLSSFIIRNVVDKWGTFNETSSGLKVCLNDQYTKNLLKTSGVIFDCSDICFTKNIKIDLNTKNCIKNCNESEYKYEYNNLCHNECPDKTYPIENNYLCLDIKPEGYYLNLTDKVYKKCYETCENCFGYGDEINNNCIECKSYYISSNGTIYNFLYELNMENYKNCYIKCPYYFYINKTSVINYCTINKTCPEEYSSLIYETNECVYKCEEDNIYKYEYQKRCYEECPYNTTKPENNTNIDQYFCKPICTGENPFENIPRQECVKNCPLKDYKEKTCIQNYKIEKMKKFRMIIMI